MSIVAALFMLAAIDGQNGQWGGKGAQLRHYAACLVSVDRHDAQALVRSPIGSRDQSHFGQRLASSHPGCLQKHGITLIHGDIVRGMISEIYLHKDPSFLEASRQKPDSIPIRLPSGLDERAFLNSYAQCLNRSSPSRAAAVLETIQGTEGERKAVLAFGGVLSACMAVDIAYHIDFEEVLVHLATQIYYDATVG